MNRKLTRALALSTGAVLLVAACGGAAQPKDDGVLRIAMGSPGEAQIRVWDAVADEFEKANSGTTVEINYQDDDLYQTIGLQNLLAGRNAPDIYFEWTGARLAQRQKDGYVADITAAFKDGALKGIFADETLGAYTVDGKTTMVPYSADVTTVIWYNTELFAANSITPPQTWAELLGACATLNAAGVTPISLGNKDLWPAGNFFGHLASRVVGEQLYSDTLGGKLKFSAPEWERAFDRIKELADAKCVNESANAIDDNAGAQLFFSGSAAMHPIGSWLVSWAIDEAPDLQFDYVNLPDVPDAKGNNDSVIGVATGYVINEKSAKKDKALAFMAMLNSDANVQALIEAEVTPLTKSASTGEDIDSRSVAMTTLLNEAPVIVLPPDTGYDLKVADALYQGIAAVLGGQSSPKDALAEIDRKLSR